MIADFYESFNEGKDDNLDIPQEILAILNQRLPRNFAYYKEPKTGRYVVDSSFEHPSGKMIFTVDFEQEEFDKLKNIPRDKWAEYIYRTQKAIPVKNLRIGDDQKQIPIENTFGNPFHDNTIVTKVMMYPQPFPEPVAINLESPEGEKIDIYIQQQAHDSLTEIKFANVNFPALNIEFYIKSPLLDDFDDDEVRSKVSYSVTPTKAETVTDALTALHIFAGLMAGTTKINGMTNETEVPTYSFKKEQIEDALSFWEAVKALEEKVGVSFRPDAEFPEEDVRFFNELDKCFLQGKRICWKHPFEHFHVSDIQETNEIDFENIIGKEEISYRFLEGPISATLMGAEFEIYSYTEFVDLIITNVEWDNDQKSGGEIYVADAPEKTWKLIRKYITVEEAEKYKVTSDDSMRSGN